MKYLIKYNLYILSVYTLVMLGVLVAFWESFSMLQRFTIGFLGLITLHEWEETKFPGGFFKVMSGIMKVDMTKAPEGLLHLPPTVFIVVVTLLPLLFPGLIFLFLTVMVLGIFEGIIHIVGIKLGRLKKPYTPGMVTAEVMLIYSIVGIYFAVSKGLVAPLDWLLALVLFIGGFLVLQVSVYRILDLKFADVVMRMKANLKSMRG
ncbi:MAG TPA: HXXEE domain-containing protein [Anaerolineaceae bacterium]|nr:HXXEE domain-containing protein [Anaerolineaceae bacterium]